MNFLNKLGLIVNVLILGMIGVEAILLGTGWSNFAILEEYLKLPNANLIFAGIGCGLIALGLLILYVDCKISQQEKGIIQKTPYGEVKVAKKAIEDFIKRISSEESFIKTIKPKLILKKKYSKLSLVVSVWSDIPTNEATLALQSRVKESLENIIGLSNLRDIKVAVEEVVHRGGRLRGIEYTKVENRG
ncbi:MAG: alkaline shock response membrane anchor protein AmaP [bacterium]